MSYRLVGILGLGVLLSACASIDGVYLPVCEAYSGSEIRLEAGRYTWSKFTDQVEVNADGNEIDPFPGFPQAGAYSVDGKTVVLTPDSGDATATLHLHKQNEAVYLLTDAENAAVEAGGELPQCALKRQSRGTSN